MRKCCVVVSSSLMTRVSVRSVMVLGLMALLSGPAGADPDVPPVVTPRSPIAVDGQWPTGLTEAIWTLCVLVDCGNNPIDLRSAGDDLSLAVERVIDAYRASGVVEGLSVDELKDGVMYVDYTLWLLGEPDVTLDPGLVAEFSGALVEIRNELLSRQ